MPIGIGVDDKGNTYTVKPGRNMGTEKQGHTPGPWEATEYRVNDWRVNSPDGKGGCWWVAELSSAQTDQETQANAALIANAPWYALLLKAVLKGWTCTRYAKEHSTGGVFALNDQLDCVVYLDADLDGLPACPDAETFERIRKAVEGE